jgi:hypothetical protein
MDTPTVSADEAYRLLESASPPEELTVRGVLDYSDKMGRHLPAKFPKRLTVDVLDLSGRKAHGLPSQLSCYELNLSRSEITFLPETVQATSRIDLSGCERLERLPEGLSVGTLILRGCRALKELPEHLDVWFLDLTGCWAFESWPRSAQIRGGRLQLRSCTALRSLPPYIQRLSALNVRDCPNLKSLPDELVISGWVDLGHSGLTVESLLPAGLSRTQLRWAGINVDRRVAFRPEEIRVDEVLEETNAERRRVMLDRYGYGRFLQDSQAEILDHDTDPGGPRQLMRLALTGDEDLVALSCFCPSTGRRYMIRVPPTTSTCHAAAAWIAGFDNPDDYRPVQET